MSNLSLNESINYNTSVSVQEIPSLDQLLNLLGFDEWQIITSAFVLPSLSFLGMILCALSGWIFFQKKFKDPVFFYYRLLCLVYIIHLAINIPKGFFFTPRYFPKIDTYSTSIYQMYYSFTTNFLLHFAETLQIGIVLTRMKTFTPFVKRHFTASPRIVTLIFFLTCLCIDFPVMFFQQVVLVGEYYINKSDGSKQSVKYFTVNGSEFSKTLLGRFCAGFVAFANLFLSIVVGVILNIVLVVKYKLYLNERRSKAEAYSSKKIVFTNHMDLLVTNNIKSNPEIQQEVTIEEPTTSRPQPLTQKEINENRAERNMFYMALTLSSITIISRVVIISCVAYFLIFNTFSSNPYTFVILLSVQTFVPTSSIFVFYFFNKMFREEFNRMGLFFL
jgi:hypothetical protein